MARVWALFALEHSVLRRRPIAQHGFHTLARDCTADACPVSIAGVVKPLYERWLSEYTVGSATARSGIVRRKLKILAN